MEEKNTRELNPDEMDKVNGGKSQIEITISSPVPGFTSEREHDPNEHTERRRYD